MDQYIEKIESKLSSLDPQSMTEAERAVMSVLVDAWKVRRRVTQEEIARSKRWIGCHPKHEADIVTNKMRTTTRMVRQVIRDLRTKYLVPIVSNEVGYTFARSEAEAQQYIESLEQKAKSQAAAWHETYRSMREALNVQSNFFENMPV